MWDDTKVFEYAVGSSKVFADPLEIHNDLTEVLGGDINKVLAEAHHEEPSIRCVAVRRLIPAVRVAFRLKEFDRETGDGVVGEDCLKILTHFVQWEDALKKKCAVEPTPSSVAEALTS